ncbi:lysin B [Mycobacterium phage Milly]|uniref:endolysin n=1 Tax=Mycobacterium phage Milly TaxID=1567473 RepID=UPI000572A9E2|nr:endolysin [Mycobacterium phage Milly]AJA43702.1 lysin B [Mycobacterium phage Milly]
MATVDYRLGMSGEQVKVIKRLLIDGYYYVRERYPRMTAASDVYDVYTQASIVEFQFRAGLPVTGVADYATQVRLGAVVPPPPPRQRIMVLTFSGTSADMWTGYPADVARALDPAIFYWQPVCYGPNGIPAIFPMGSSAKSGEVEGLRLLDEKAGDFDYVVLIGYSQGALPASRLMRRILSGDLQRFKSKLIAGVTFGNPMREKGHTFPGGADPGGHGLDPQCLVGTPDWWHDHATKGDIYTCGSGGNDETANADMTFIYQLVQGDILGMLFGTGNPLDLLGALGGGLLGGLGGGMLGGKGGLQLPSGLVLPGVGLGQGGALTQHQRGLVEAVLALLTNPFAEVPPAVKAIVSGVGFIATNPPTAPHIEYHIREAAPGVTHLQHAIDYLRQVGASVAARAA